MNINVEWAPFQLNAGISQAQLLTAAQAFQTHFLQSQVGYKERQLLHLSENIYADLIQWYSSTDAKAAAAAAAQHWAGHAYFQLMQAADMPSGMLHLEQLLAFKD